MDGLPVRPACPSPLAVMGWNLLGGIEWGGIEVAAEIIGVVDIDLWLHELAAIRSHLEGRH